jgi:hypothetical protein
MTVATSTVLGRPLWYELMTTDMTAAESFYRDVVGWKTAPFAGTGRPYTMFNRGADVAIGGVLKKPDEVNAPPCWAMYVGVPKLEDAAAHVNRLGGLAHAEIYFRVPDVHAAAERSTAKGGQILNGPMQVPDGDRIVNAMDPQGAAFGLHSKKPS